MKLPLLASLLLASPLLLNCSKAPGSQSPDLQDIVTNVASAGAQSAQAKAQDTIMAPRVRLRLSGSMQGRLTPCGCASGQLGGLPRRIFYLQANGNYDLLIEGGNQVGGNSPLEENKLYTSLDILGRAKYHAIGLGSKDLALDMSALELFPEYGIPVIASDLVSKDESKQLTKAFTEHKIKEATVRIASFTRKLAKEGDDSPFKLLTAKEAWQRAMHQVDPTHYRILLVHDSHQEVLAMAKLEPKPDLIVGINNHHNEPPTSYEQSEGVPVVYPGIRGRFLLDVTLTRSEQGPALVNYQPIALEGSRTSPGAMEDKVTLQAIMGHRNSVKEDGLREKMANKIATANGASYVGSAECGSCHEEDYQSWQDSKHAQAWETLVQAEGKKYQWPVTHHPDCVKCHTVGYTQQTGFISPEKTADLRGVGCEECHGAGSKHSEAPEEVKMGPVANNKCRQCHDFEQSPDFDFNQRWDEIKHGDY